MAADVGVIVRSWQRRMRLAAVSWRAPARSRGTRRHGRPQLPGSAPALTIWTLDRDTVQAALERDWR